jgi:hypothetical protein
LGEGAVHPVSDPGIFWIVLSVYFFLLAVTSHRALVRLLAVPEEPGE